MYINQFEKSSKAWIILTDIAKKKCPPIQYGNLSNQLFIHRRTIRYVLSNIQDYCLDNNLPPLSIMAVNRHGFPGQGFIAFDINNLDEGIEKVHYFDWNSVPNPFDFSDEIGGFNEFLNKLKASPSYNEDIYIKTRKRGMDQIIFREVIKNCYKNKCAFTGITGNIYQSALEACHIKPWVKCSSNEKLDTQNGILLNSFHHVLFDIGMITINKDFKIVCNEKILNRRNMSKLEKSLTIDLHGKNAYVPNNKLHCPHEKYLLQRYKINNWEPIL